MLIIHDNHLLSEPEWPSLIGRPRLHFCCRMGPSSKQQYINLPSEITRCPPAGTEVYLPLRAPVRVTRQVLIIAHFLSRWENACDPTQPISLILYALGRSKTRHTQTLAGFEPICAALRILKHEDLRYHSRRTIMPYRPGL